MNKAIKNQYAPDIVSSPGETLLETIEALGMSQAELAGRTGRPKKTISEIVQGKAAITPETALQFENVLQVPASFWLNFESRYREHLARQQERDSLQADVDWLSRFPISEMIKRRWLARESDAIQQLKSLLAFFGVSSRHAWEAIWTDTNIAYRKSRVYESNEEATAVWLRKGEIDAHDLNCRAYDASRFLQALQDARRLTLEDPKVFVPGLRDLCAKAGVAVVFVPEVDKVRVSGATRWLSSEKALIQLSLRYKTNDHLWFTLFHEAGHIVKHGKKGIFLEAIKDGDQGRLEDEADRFACDTLIPPKSLAPFVRKGRFTEQTIKQFADEIGIAPGIVVGRLQHDGLIKYSYFSKLKVSYQWARQ